MSKKKIFVLDTNVMLHDYNSIYKFEDNDIIIPITSLEELDKFKVGNQQINYNARHFTKQLDTISNEDIMTKGVKLGDGLGTLRIEQNQPFSDKIKNAFKEDTADHRILAVADYLKSKNKSKQVILVTKDINLRVKAKSLEIISEDFENDKVEVDFLNKEYHIKDVDPNIIKSVYEAGFDIKNSEYKNIPLNQHMILDSGQNSVLAYQKNNILKQVEKKKILGITPRNAEQTFSLNVCLDKDITLIALTGKAGTGKTLIALASALKQQKQYEQILLARPTIELSNSTIGFLPGDVMEKLHPYMMPLFDNLSVIKRECTDNEKNMIEELQKDEKLKIEPLSFIRGRSLSNSFLIVDEAQNLTKLEIKTIVTRAAEGTKILFAGDVDQIDSPYLDKHSNGLSYLIDKMQNQDIFCHINLVKGERSYMSDLAAKLL